MTRVKTGSTRRKRHKKIKKLAKGYRMTKGRLYKVSKEAVLHAGQYAFAGRRLRKRDMRRLWIERINAGLTPFKIKYSRFIHLLKTANIDLNRKMLANMVATDPVAFKAVVNKVQSDAKKAKKTKKPSKKAN